MRVQISSRASISRWHLVNAHSFQPESLSRCLMSYVALVHPRSGLAIKHGVTMVNAPGTVDAGFRGELQCIMINHDPRESVTFKRGDRIAQLVFQKVERAEFIEVQELPGSGRGTGGFGSTGRQ